MTNKLVAGQEIPSITLKSLSGKGITFGEMPDSKDMQMIVVYRGKHCPLCTKYLGELKNWEDKFIGLGVEVLVVSADPEEKALEQTKEKLELPFEVGVDLSIDDMNRLGVYISDPRSPEETDRPFAEPATFIVRKDKKIQIMDISNAPFSRPEIEALYNGLKFIKDKDYPIRGTHT